MISTAILLRSDLPFLSYTDKGKIGRTTSNITNQESIIDRKPLSPSLTRISKPGIDQPEAPPEAADCLEDLLLQQLP